MSINRGVDKEDVVHIIQMSFLTLILALVGRVSSPDVQFCSGPLGRSLPPVEETEMRSHGE